MGIGEDWNAAHQDSVLVVVGNDPKSHKVIIHKLIQDKNNFGKF